MIKVAIIGPESTGKTELAKMLAEDYQASWVPEFSRDYLTDLGRPYAQEDLLKIAQGQRELETSMAQTEDRLLFCDTDMHVMKVWSEYKYGTCDSWILKELEQQDYDLYVLTYFDIPYEDDPLREHPEGRAYFFEIYKGLLESSQLPHVIVKGNREERLQEAKRHIDPLL